jgi:hypothetical protein
MKKFAFIFALVLAAGCSIDQSKAKTAVEGLEQKLSTGDYAGTAPYFSDQMKVSETADQRVEKFKNLHDAVGDFVSMECISSKNATDPNDQPCVNLEYKVKHTKVTTTEDFTVVKEEGNYKISEYDIKQN